MAKKRMFSLGVLETDAFMDMPLSAQALYFHLNMRADDDGFIGNPKRITRNIGANEDDLKLLIAKRFVLAFDDGVIVIKHWRMHNAIKKDRYTKTNFIDDLNMLHLKENGSYTFSELPEQRLDDWSANGEQLENKSLSDINCQNAETSVNMQLEHDWSTNGAQMEQTCSTGLGLGLGLGLDKGLDKNNNINTSVSIPLIDGTEWNISKELFDEYVKTYPSLDITQELREMRSWCISNPTKKKTRKGITRFVNGWLKKSLSYHKSYGNEVCGADNLII